MSEVTASESIAVDQHTSVTTMSQVPTEQFEVDDTNVAVNVVESEVHYPKGAKLVAICAALAIVLISIGLDISIVAVTIPALSDQFQTISDIAWYSTALRLSMCSVMFLAGKAYTVFSVKNLFLLSLAVFEIGNVLCTFALTSVMFIVGRAICGIGTAGMIAGVFTIFNHTFPLRQRPLVGGIGGAIETLAGVSAPLIGGYLVTGWTWRACFGINIPLGLFGCAIIFIFMKLDPNPDESLPLKEKIRRLDLLGTAVFAPAITSLLLALQWGGTTYSWNSAPVIVLFVVFAGLMATFFFIEWKSGEKASLPFRILKNQSLLAGAFFAMCCNATVAVIEYYLSIYFQGVRGYTAAKTGIYALPLIIGICVAAPLAGAFTTWIGYYFQNMYVTTVLASVSVGVLTTIDIDTSLPLLLCMTCVLGVAFGAGIQAPQVAAQTILKPSEVSIGIAIIVFGSQIGPVLFLATGGALFTNRLREEVKTYAPTTNITSIENMGLTNIRNAFGPDTLRGVLTGYNEALVQTMYLPLGLACVSILGAALMERKSVKKTQ